MPKMPEHLLPEGIVARIMGVSPSWLQRQRWLGTGPKFVRIGGKKGSAVRYRPEDVDAWIKQNIFDPDNESDVS